MLVMQNNIRLITTLLDDDYDTGDLWIGKC